MKNIADKSNHFVRHNENVSSDFRSNIKSLTEDIVSPLYTHYG